MQLDDERIDEAHDVRVTEQQPWPAHEIAPAPARDPADQEVLDGVRVGL